MFHTCQVTLDISVSPIDFQWADGNIQGNLKGMVFIPGKFHFKTAPDLYCIQQQWQCI